MLACYMCDMVCWSERKLRPVRQVHGPSPCTCTLSVGDIPCLFSLSPCLAAAFYFYDFCSQRYYPKFCNYAHHTEIALKFKFKFKFKALSRAAMGGLRPPFSEPPEGGLDLKTIFALCYPHYRHIFVYPFFNSVPGRGSVSTANERRQCSIIVYDDLLWNALVVERASKQYGHANTFHRSTSSLGLAGAHGEFLVTRAATELMHGLRRKNATTISPALRLLLFHCPS